MNEKTWALTMNEEGEVVFPPELLDDFGWDDDTSLDVLVDEDEGSITVKESDQCKP